MLDCLKKCALLLIIISSSLVLDGCLFAVKRADVAQAFEEKDIHALINALSAPDALVRCEAATYILKLGKNASGELIEVLKKQDDPVACGYAAMLLGELRVNEAVPVLVEKFYTHRDAHVVVVDDLDVLTTNLKYVKVVNQRYIDLWEDFDLWKERFPDEYYSAMQIMVRIVGVNLEGMTIHSIPDVKALKGRFGKYVEVVGVQVYQADYHLEDYATDDIFVQLMIYYSLDATQYALFRITGQDFGSDRSKWKAWLKDNMDTYSIKRRGRNR